MVLEFHVVVDLVGDDVVGGPVLAESRVCFEFRITVFVTLCDLQEAGHAHESLECEGSRFFLSFLGHGVGQLGRRHDVCFPPHVLHRRTEGKGREVVSRLGQGHVE